MGMKIFADLHFHSKYSRAVSPDMDLEHLAAGARIKGLQLLGTGDFSHPLWFKELKSKLEPSPFEGLYQLKKESGEAGNRVLFMLTNEVATFFSDAGKSRKVHHVLHAPSFEVVEQLNDLFAKRSNLAADGRPMFARTSCAELADICFSVSKEIAIVPAHCLLPSELLHCNDSLKKFEDILVGDAVLTHKGRWKKVEKVLTREYAGKLVQVIPQYFRQGLSTTPEHPFFAIKTVKKCPSTHGTCRPLCASSSSCARRYFAKYAPVWVQAKNLEVGDALAFPRQRVVKDLEYLDVSGYLPEYATENGFLRVKSSRFKPIPARLRLDSGFCRLVGYYLAEGYVNSNLDSVAFCFSSKEKKYAKDVCFLVKKYFGLALSRRIDDVASHGVELVFYSQPMARIFRRLFYSEQVARANTKVLPKFMLYLKPEKQAQLFLGWWRGDSGYTVSRLLAAQFQVICLRLGVMPSIAIDSVRSFEKRGKHVVSREGRRVCAGSDLVAFSNLSFFDDSYGLLRDPCFKKFRTKRATRHGWLDENYAYLPIRKIVEKKYSGSVYNLEVEDDNSYVAEFAAVHNCWTPWFGIFGSESGYDSLKEAFQGHEKNIFAIETGMSSDPAMNWRLSQLDLVSLMSNSDSHSPHPWRLGRECNCFDFQLSEGTGANERLSYQSLFKAVKKKDKNRFLFTIETDPSYGKYHFDGHRLCNFSSSPEESRKLKGVCPVCHRPLTIGVLNRVEELADRPEGFLPQGVIPFKSLLPLHELLSASLGEGLYSKKVAALAEKTYSALGSELSVLLDAPRERLEAVAGEKLAQIILLNREGGLFVKPGFDGEYGVAQIPDELKIGEKKERKPSAEKQAKPKEEKQKGLSDYF